MTCAQAGDLAAVLRQLFGRVLVCHVSTLRPRKPASQHSVHYHRVDQAEPRMFERLRQTSDDLKSKALP